MSERRHGWRVVALAWSALVAGLMALASSIGLLFPSLYRDNLLVSLTASTFALVLGVASLDVHEVARQVGHRATRAVAAFLLFLALGLGGFHAAVAAWWLWRREP